MAVEHGGTAAVSSRARLARSVAIERPEPAGVRKNQRSISIADDGLSCFKLVRPGLDSSVRARLLKI